MCTINRIMDKICTINEQLGNVGLWTSFSSFSILCQLSVIKIYMVITIKI